MCCNCSMCISFTLFFFFKQKTAYEMRISDWSSDVCSSDLRGKFNRFSLDDLMTAATAAGIAPPAPRKSSWDDLRGIVKGNGARFTIEEINDAIAEAGAAAGSVAKIGGSQR